MKHEGTGRFTPFIPHLLDIIEQDDPPDLWRALGALRAIGPDAVPAVPLLIRLLNNPQLQAESAKVLGAIGPAAAPAVSALIQVVLHPLPGSDYAHGAAAGALGVIGDPAAIPVLIEAAQNPDVQGPGLAAISALSKFRAVARPAVPVLLQLLNDERYEWADAILHALSCIGPPAGPAWNIILERLQRAQDEMTRKQMAYLLYRLVCSGGPVYPHAHVIFQELTHSHDPYIQEYGRLALTRLKTARNNT